MSTMKPSNSPNANEKGTLPILESTRYNLSSQEMMSPANSVRFTIGLSPEDAEASIRFSLGFNTTDADIDDAVNLIDNALGKLSNNELFSDTTYGAVG